MPQGALAHWEIKEKNPNPNKREEARRKEQVAYHHHLLGTHHQLHLKLPHPHLSDQEDDPTLKTRPGINISSLSRPLPPIKTPRDQDTETLPNPGNSWLTKRRI
jgi:hypothetical protein